MSARPTRSRPPRPRSSPARREEIFCVIARASGQSIAPSNPSEHKRRWLLDRPLSRTMTPKGRSHPLLAIRFHVPPGAIRRPMSPAHTPRVSRFPASVAVPAGAGARDWSPAEAGARLCAGRPIRCRSPRRRCICRPGAPAGSPREVFLDGAAADAALLPRIVPIGDIDEDEIRLRRGWATGAAAADALDLPPALGGLTRRMLLARLVLAWAQRLKAAPGDHPLVGGDAGGGARTRRRSRPPDGRHRDPRRSTGAGSTGSSPTMSTPIGSSRSTSSRSRASTGRTSWPSGRRSSRPSAATA